MPRYIDVEALKTDLRRKFVPSDNLGVGYIYDLLCIAPTVDLVPAPVRCGECIYWKDRKVKLPDGAERDYQPDEPYSVTMNVGINVGSHCTLHGFENESGSWFWSNADDFCSRGKRKGGGEK